MHISYPQPVHKEVNNFDTKGEMAYLCPFFPFEHLFSVDNPVYSVYKLSLIHIYAERFAYFSRAVLSMLPCIDFKPDIIHTNDWHTGLAGAYLKEEFMKDPYYRGLKNIFTIHNLKYQGIFGRDIVEDVLGLPLRLMHNGNLANDGDVNFMKAGMCYADYITTVSRTYAEEIRYSYFGEGLQDYVCLLYTSIPRCWLSIKNTRQRPRSVRFRCP